MEKVGWQRSPDIRTYSKNTNTSETFDCTERRHCRSRNVYKREGNADRNTYFLFGLHLSQVISISSYSMMNYLRAS